MPIFAYRQYSYKAKQLDGSLKTHWVISRKTLQEGDYAEKFSDNSDFSSKTWYLNRPPQPSVFCGHVRAIYKPVQIKRYIARKTHSQVVPKEKNQNVFIHQNFGIFVTFPPIKLPNMFKIGDVLDKSDSDPELVLNMDDHIEL